MNGCVRNTLSLGVKQVANHVSALKRAKQSEKRRLRNKSALSAMKTEIKKMHVAFSGTDAGLKKTTLKAAISSLARTASKGIIPKKRASRKISRLTLKANKAVSA
jgi:small subunit ribosomal protein S20